MRGNELMVSPERTFRSVLFPIPMRGNELETAFRPRKGAGFPIPMRGNEIPEHPPHFPEHGQFPIPMRGNEKESGYAEDADTGFPIPMRGNESNLNSWVVRGQLRSRSP